MPRFTYNAPFTLTFSITATALMLSDTYYQTEIIPNYFISGVAPGKTYTSVS